MNAREAIAYLTNEGLSPSTIHLLALERLAHGAHDLDEAEEQEIVSEILGHYRERNPGLLPDEEGYRP